jgi:hypothetical protein
MGGRPGRDVCLNFCRGVVHSGLRTRGNGFMTSQDLSADQARFAGCARYAGPTLTEQLLNEGDSPGLVTNLPLVRHHRIVIAFVGMDFEAKIAAGPGVQVVCRDSRRDLANVIENAVRQGYRGVISFGVAGGLASNLRTGDWVVASAVLDSHVPLATDAAWSSSLVATIPGATYAPILGVDAPVAEAAMKRELHKTTGACAVDMESPRTASRSLRHASSSIRPNGLSLPPRSADRHTRQSSNRRATFSCIGPTDWGHSTTRP